MHCTPPSHTLGRLAAALGILAGLLLLAGTRTASADFEKPVILPPSAAGGRVSPLPNCITVNWFHSGSGVVGFSVERENSDFREDRIGADQRSLPVCGLDPSTTYRFQVCAVFGVEDAEPECSDWVELETAPSQTSSAPQPPPTPRVVEHHAGESWIGIKWEAGHDYDSYFINYREKNAPLNTIRTIHHDDDGTWGYQRIEGLRPGRTYSFAVQGCRETFFGIGSDTCYGWSAEYDASTLPPALLYGPDTCLEGYVWREAFDGDHVCVTPQRRDQVAADNAQAYSRRDYQCTPPNCLFVAPDTCKQGFVWREARPEDHVCVTPAERSLVASENATANTRRAVPR